jgi:NADH:ubiquinone oxidoreductase subunit F (NADH-binding)
LAAAPHLVLDGLCAAAVTLGASRAVVYVPERVAWRVESAVSERRARRIDPVEIEVVVAPHAYLAGQESAVVSAVGGSDARPFFVGLRSIRQRGVGGRPTLVQNVETLANVALIARFGASWFRRLGTQDQPGTMLLTVLGRWEEPKVLEAPLGASVAEILDLSVTDASAYCGALLGGYGGTWVSMPTLLDLSLTQESARRSNAALGAGVIALVPADRCPLAEVSRVVRFMTRQGAGQCGPCVEGLAALDSEIEALAFGRASRRRSARPVLELCGLVSGRGACRHPDGVARFVSTACSVFAEEIAQHSQHGPCRAARRPPWLPLPAVTRSSGGGYR